MLFGSTGSNLNKLSNDSTFSSTAQKLHSNRMKIAFTSALSIIRINSLDVKREEKNVNRLSISHQLKNYFFILVKNRWKKALKYFIMSSYVLFVKWFESHCETGTQRKNEYQRRKWEKPRREKER